MIKVVVTGANGQLGQCLQELAKTDKELHYTFVSSKELDITNKKKVETFFNQNKFDYCVNCAAYTAVDRAEEEVDKATLVNVLGVENVAKSAKKNKVVLIHISTDFVFDGKASLPYTEIDASNPVSIYGKTKLEGERKIQDTLANYFIIRTSWLYSEYGNNFMKTMLKLGADRADLNVVNDQTGTPTYAKDLAKVIRDIIRDTSEDYGLYNYSNAGATTWYDFAKEIFKLTKNNIRLTGVSTASYPTAAIRPSYSVMSKDKIIKTLKVRVPDWKESLRQALSSSMR